jgi:3-methyl-2-oxobutanoate hydroxymethyltransferase
MRETGERISMLTCYDASFAQLLDAAQIDVMLIGDSLGMVLQGKNDTLSVSIDEIAYHVRCVAAGTRYAMVVADLPFGSYETSPEQAFESAARLMAAGAQMVKLEGGSWIAPTVEFLVPRGIPVCAHIGFTPQSVHALGGYRVQGRSPADAERLEAAALNLADAGSSLVLMEMIPAALAAQITSALAVPTAKRAAVPTIGLGAGVDCSGQVLVLHDLLGISTGVRPRFSKNFLNGRVGVNGIADAIAAYVKAVRSGEFPAPEHSF